MTDIDNLINRQYGIQKNLVPFFGCPYSLPTSLAVGDPAGYATIQPIQLTRAHYQSIDGTSDNMYFTPYISQFMAYLIPVGANPFVTTGCDHIPSDLRNTYASSAASEFWLGTAVAGTYDLTLVPFGSTIDDMTGVIPLISTRGNYYHYNYGWFLYCTTETYIGTIFENQRMSNGVNNSAFTNAYFIPTYDKALVRPPNVLQYQSKYNADFKDNQFASYAVMPYDGVFNAWGIDRSNYVVFQLEETTPFPYDFMGPYIKGSSFRSLDNPNPGDYLTQTIAP